ncbi:KCNIP4 (predicted) [Pycnogonum litorale]
MYGMVSSQSSTSGSKSKQRRSNLGYQSPTGDIEKRPKASLYRRFVKFVRHTVSGIQFDSEFDDLEGQAVHYRPESIDALCRVTKFNKRELKSMYRGFKQECPTGVVREETFKEIYARFFPRGADSSQYAHYVFNTFDQDSSGALSFEDFVVGLSVLARGSLHEKLRWAFTLYDINGDGFITKDELGDIVNAIYDLMGRCSDPVIDDTTTKDHVDKVFQKLDMNKDGVVTIEEFMDYCSRDESIKKSISALNTVL